MKAKELLIGFMIPALLSASSCQQATGRPPAPATEKIICTKAPAKMPRLTPRPTSVSSIDKLQVGLNGRWHFNPNPPEDFWSTDAQTSTSWADIEVPGEWVMQGFSVEKDTAAGYRRQFTLPPDWKGRRIKLRCDAVYSDAKVWINGLEAGQHVGGFTPFELDITELVEFGRDNTIAFAVRNESPADTLASGTFYAAHQLGGITRKIYIFAVPQLNISSLHVETTFDRDYRDASLRVMIEIANEGGQDIQDAEVQFNLKGPDGKAIAIEPSTVKLPAVKAGQTIKQTIEIPVTAPKKWDAEHPNLYTLTCQLRVTDKLLETTQRRFGFRQVKIRERQLFVNNRPVKLRGICRHEVHPLRGRSLTPELCRKDAELFRNANMNFIRTSHYPPSEEFLDACDELGIFVEDEAPFCWAFRWKKGQDDPKYQETIVQQTLEMVQRDRSHPCIIIWSTANESTWGSNFEKSAEAIRRADASRPRIFSWHHALDIVSHHYPGADISDELARFDVPVLFDEYMHLNCYNRSEVVTDPGVREDWGRSLASVWEKMYAAEECLGGAIWSGIDDIFHLPGGKSTGYGPWGPLDGWRRTKPEYWHIKKAYSPIKIFAKTVGVPNKGEPIKLEVENRHDFTNLGEINIEWTIASQSGRVKADIRPRGTGTILIQPKTTDVAGKRLSLQFFSPRGFIIDSYLLPIGSSEMTVPKSGIQACGGLRLLRDENNFVVKGDRFTWVVDRRTGLIEKAEIDGRAVLIGGPTLMVLPQTGGKCEPTYHDDIMPFTNTCSQWQVSDVTAGQSTDDVEICVKGRYKEASGTYTMHINNKGELTVVYRFSYDGEIKPLQPMWGPLEPARLRQLGIVFDLPKSFNTLNWQRNALWTVYPEDHIGRPEGQARAFRRRKWPNIKTHTEPHWPWHLDSNALGTNDFRSTKRNIIWASLKDANDYGILIRSDGEQSTRSYLEGDRIRLLTAGHSTGGRDGVSFGHLGEEQKPFEKGSVFEDSVRLELVGPPR